MNVSPMTIPGVKKKLKTVLGAFDTHRFTHVSKRGLKWSEYQKKLCLELEMVLIQEELKLKLLKMCRVKVASKKLLVKVGYTKIIVYQMPLVCAHVRQEVLGRKVAKQIKETLERQLGAMKFYRDEPIDQEIKKKMKQTPMTNCGSEHEFAHADNDLRQSGGSTSLTTVSSKHVIKQNELYKKEKWTCLSEEERTERWRWAHGSEEAKKVRQLDKEFREKLKALQKVAYEEKVAKKQASDRKFLEILEKCKKHGGPITMKEVEKLEALTYDEVLLEVKFLKRTTGPQLRIKRKVEKKFVNYTRDQLIQQIKDVLKPRMESDICLENLLATALDLTEGDETSVPENRHNSSPPIGAHGLWRGPRDEQILGVLVDDTTIQKYKKTRTGYLPFGLPDNAAEWEQVEVIPDDKYHYVQKNHGVYLVLE